jgi:drug/metabolite transporter (DMT)-like permease
MPAAAYACSLAAIALWSTLALLSVKLASVPPFLLVGVTLLLGGLGGVGHLRQWRVPGTTLLLGVYGIFVYHFCLFLALRRAPPVEANLLNYLWPLLIVLLSPVVLPGYRLAARHVVAGGLGFAGAGLVVTGGQLRAAPEHAAGYGLAILAALIWSTYSLLTRRVATFPSAAVGLFCVVSGAISLVAHALLEPAYTFRSGEILPLLLLGAGPMGGAFFLWDAALKRGDPRIIGSLAYLTPLLSTSLLVLFGGGHLSPFAGVGMGLIVLAAVLGTGIWRRATAPLPEGP